MIFQFDLPVICNMPFVIYYTKYSTTLIQTADIGLELMFALHTLLLKDVEKWIRDGRDKMIEAVKLRGQEDTWKTMKFENKDQLNKFIEDMNDIGIANIQAYVMG